ncbi:MAG: T9SS type A sorting domain-containing protein [Saprospiraceae bacterium]
MQLSTTVNLSTPCTAAGDQLVPLSKGSYCHTCEKQVVDYTSMSDRELVRALRQNPTGCGTFRRDQLNRPLIENELVRRGYSLAAIALLLAMQLCALEVSGQTISPNAHIEITSAIATSGKSQANQLKDLTIRELNVIDNEGYPLSYATVAILNDDFKIIGGEATDSAGSVFLKLTDQAASIRVSYIGYQHQEISIESLEDNLIELLPLSSQLAEVEIIAFRGSNSKGGYSSTGISYINTKKEVWNHDFPADPNTKLTLFPNPSTGQSTLKSELLKEGILVNVYSSIGQLVMSVPLVDKRTSSIQLQLSNQLPSGNYIVELVLKTGSTEVVKWMVAR